MRTIETCKLCCTNFTENTIVYCVWNIREVHITVLFEIDRNAIKCYLLNSDEIQRITRQSNDNYCFKLYSKQ